MINNISKKLALGRLYQMYISSKSSTIRTKWEKMAKRCVKFLHGDQWDDQNILKSMEDIGAKPFTLNFISSVVSDLLSVVLRLNMRISYVPKNMQHISTAQVLRSWVLDAQSKSLFPLKNKKQFENHLVTGLGFMHTVISSNLDVTMESINPFNVVFDTSDLSSNLHDLSFIGYDSFKTIEDFAINYPGVARELKLEIKGASIDADLNLANTSEYDNWFIGNRIKVVNIYYKVITDYYRCKVIINDQEVYFETFDENLAKQKSEDGKYSTGKATQIWLGVFHDNILLEHYPIPSQVPNQKEFPITPSVYSRDADGNFHSFVEKLIDIQTLKNLVFSEMHHYNFAQTIFISDEIVDTDKIADKVKLESGKRSGVVAVPNPEKVQVTRQDRALPFLANAVGLADRERDYVSGLEKEFLGGKGNVTSGVGRQKIEQLTMDAQLDTITQVESLLFNLGNVFLNGIRGNKDFNFTLELYSPNGDTYDGSLDDTAILTDMSVNVEKFANFSSSFASSNQLVVSLIGTPLEMLLLSPEMLITQLGIDAQVAVDASRNYLKIQKLVRNNYYTDEEIQQQQAIIQQNSSKIN